MCLHVVDSFHHLLRGHFDLWSNHYMQTPVQRSYITWMVLHVICLYALPIGINTGKHFFPTVRETTRSLSKSTSQVSENYIQVQYYSIHHMGCCWLPNWWLACKVFLLKFHRHILVRQILIGKSIPIYVRIVRFFHRRYRPHATISLAASLKVDTNLI